MRGRSIGILSRGYKGLVRGPAQVLSDGSSQSAVMFGDEPTWLAARLPKIPLVVGADRLASAAFLEKFESIDFLLADDGFQHRRMYRDYDIVIVDVTEPLWHYRPLPFGRMREPFSSLKRAQAVFLTKVNLSDVQVMNWLKLQITLNGYRGPIFEFESKISGLSPLSSADLDRAQLNFEQLVREDGKNGIFLVSAIGNPNSFARLVEIESRKNIKGHLVFADHHFYSNADKEKIVREAKTSGASCIVVTEKDAGKLGRDWKPEIPVWVTRLENVSRQDLKDFYESVDRALF